MMFVYVYIVTYIYNFGELRLLIWTFITFPKEQSCAFQNCIVFSYKNFDFNEPFTIKTKFSSFNVILQEFYNKQTLDFLTDFQFCVECN